MKIVVATRIHSTHHSRPVPLQGLRDWCLAALQEAQAVLLAVDTANLDAARAETAGLGEAVEILHVSPWHGVTPALNAVLIAAVSRFRATHLLLRSLEVGMAPGSLACLKALADNHTLVVGARLTPEHGQCPGLQPLNGNSCPWNTLALWNLSILRLTGFQVISDGLEQSEDAGVEEVVAISLLQFLHPGRAKAVLLTVPGVDWAVEWDDPCRQNRHQLKMQSKLDRSERQLRLIGIPRGQVLVREDV